MAIDLEDIKNVAVIGAGLMGHGIAQVFAVCGYRVALLDTRDEILSQAVENIRSNLTIMAQRGIGHPDEIESTVKRIRTTLDLEEAVRETQFVVEAVSEDVGLKQRIFGELDAVCLESTILATNTSVIGIGEIGSKAKMRGRILGTHFWNPPYLIPLVEVIPSNETTQQVMETAFELLKRVGKHPVRVNRDVPGFVGNRLQHALWREAISIVENGIADPATVDEVIKYGFGIRLPVLGPLESADMIGLDLTLAIHSYIMEDLERSPEPAPLLREKVEGGKLGFKTGEGFQKWPPEAIERSWKNLREHLLKWTEEQEEIREK